MNTSLFSLVTLVASVAGIVSPLAAADNPPAFRPPSVPLVVHDPLFSIWSNADRLTDDATRHWTTSKNSLVSLIRIDGKTYRLMGNTPADVPAMTQERVAVTPTRTIYNFSGAGVRVTLTFLTPVLPDDLDILSRPVTYLNWTVTAADGATHTVSIYDGTSAELTVNKPTEKVGWTRETMGDLTALRTGTAAQELLVVSGDSARIDWGYAYAAAASAEAKAAAGADDALTTGFVQTGTRIDAEEGEMIDWSRETK